MSKANLEGILPHGTVVVISMTASTTNGKPLTPQAWARVEEACKLVFELEAARRKVSSFVPISPDEAMSTLEKGPNALTHPLLRSTWSWLHHLRARVQILQYVESRMTFLAPNLSAVVGTRVATKILGVAGGLTGLSKIPACNVHVS